MNQTSLSTAVVCRPALIRDRTDVFEFCKGIWDGDDYVPEVWDEWFNDPQGVLAVAELDGHAIGCSKITCISQGQWWLEGFRVDPKFQGLKVGSHLHDFVTNWWLEHGDGTLRLMTKANNFAVHRVCEKTGYSKTHEVCGYQATSISEPTESFSPVTDMHEAAAFASASESLKMTEGLSDFGWRIGMPDESIFDIGSQTDQPHAFYWWRNGRGLLSAWDSDEGDKLHLGITACTLKDLPALLADARRLAAQQKMDSVVQIAFDIPVITSQLETAGFEKYWNNNAFIFQKKHPDR